MKDLPRYVLIYGIASGVLFFAARMLYSHPHLPTPPQLLNHTLTSAPIVLIHWLGLSKLRTPTSRIPLTLLVLLNLLMACLFLAGIAYLRSTGCGPLKLGAFVVLWLVPFLFGTGYFAALAWKSALSTRMAANQRLERPVTPGTDAP
jgi:hypothetical protein